MDNRVLHELNENPKKMNFVELFDFELVLVSIVIPPFSKRIEDSFTSSAIWTVKIKHDS